ncbi:MAG: damage-inducible protein CinA [Magnetovibrio sp.]|nr:damage-inducible protein CinA [Magnetovibrio sp.]
MIFNEELRGQATLVLAACRDKGLQLATVESCTGGLIIGLLTDIAGASDVIERGFITYSNEAKRQMLNVSETLLECFGAVSEEVAHAMAEGAINNSYAQIAVSTTGIAGPGGGNKIKPVGLVHIAVAREHYQTLHERYIFTGDRQGIRDQAVVASIALLIRMLEK